MTSPPSPSTHQLDSKTIIRFAGLIAGPALAALMLLILPEHYRGANDDLIPLTAAGRATLALMAWMAAWWLTEAIDVSATALLPIAFLPLAGAATIKQAAAPYASDLIFLFMGGFILALSMQRWGLDRRIALITLRIVGAKPRSIILGCMVASATISAFVSNTATAAMMLPVGMSVVSLVISRSRQGAPDSSPSAGEVARHEASFGVCMMLGIAYACSIGGVMTIIGSPPNVFLVGFIKDAYGWEISFLQWMMIGVPLAAVFLPLAWLLLTRVLFPVRIDSIEGGRELITATHRALGPPNRGERATFIVFTLTALAWMARPFLVQMEIGAFEQRVQPMKGLTDSGLAIIAALVLFIIPINVRKREFVMNWPIAAKLPWGVLILFGGGLSLAAAIEANGVAEFIGAQALSFAGVPPLLLVVLVAAAVAFLSELASNTAIAATLIPILAAMAPGLGVHPYLLIVPAALAASYAFMLPAGTPPNAIVFGTGHVTMQQMIKAGFWLNLIGIVLIVFVTYAVVIPVLGNP